MTRLTPTRTRRPPDMVEEVRERSGRDFYGEIGHKYTHSPKKNPVS